MFNEAFISFSTFPSKFKVDSFVSLFIDPEQMGLFIIRIDINYVAVKQSFGGKIFICKKNLKSIFAGKNNFMYKNGYQDKIVQTSLNNSFIFENS